MRPIRCSCTQCKIRMRKRAGSNDMRRITKAARRKTKQMITQGKFDVPTKVSVPRW